MSRNVKKPKIVLSLFIVVSLIISTFTTSAKTCQAASETITLPKVENVLLAEKSPYVINKKMKVGDTLVINVPIPSYDYYYFGATRFNYHDGYLNGSANLGDYVSVSVKEAGIFDVYWTVTIVANKAMDSSHGSTKEDIRGCYPSYLCFASINSNSTTDDNFVILGIYVTDSSNSSVDTVTKPSNATKKIQTLVVNAKKNKKNVSGVTIPNAKVKITVSNKSNKQIYTGKSDSDGKYNLKLLSKLKKKSTVKVTVSKKGYKSKSMIINIK